MAATYTGKIILINRIRGFGFIECPKLGVNVFFSKSGTTVWDTLEVFDRVQFVKYESSNPNHLGKPFAARVTLVGQEKTSLEKKFSPFNRWVGKVTAWDGSKGYLEVSTLSNRIFLYHTTLAYCRMENVHQGDLFLVHPVKSKNLLSDYFALWAYPLQLETNPDFLQEAWEKNDEQGILDAIEENLLKTGHAGRLWQLYCDRYLKDLGEAKRLQEIVNMIDRFRRWGFEPGLDDLDNAAGGNGSILLTLWFREKTKHFKPDEVSAFFKSTSDDWRDQVLRLSDEGYRIRLLTEYGKHLAAQGQLSANTPRLRYLLKTAKDYGDGVRLAVWDTVETHLEQLRPEDKIQLWALGLFKDLDLTKYLSQISLKETELWLSIINRNSDEGESLTKVILDLFLEKTDRNRFDDWYPSFIPVMRAAAKKWPELAATVHPRLRQLLSAGQLLTLGLLGLEDYLEEHADFREVGGGGWPMYALVRYALQKKIAPEEMRRLFLAHGFSAERLLSEIPNLPWSQVLQPCRTKPEIDYEIGYLNDLSDACRLAGFPEIKVLGETSLATCIFESVKTREAFHARLWLNEFVPRDYYDYEGFREPFKKLTREEKRLFVKPSQEMMEDVADVQVTSEILPCYDYKENGAERIYRAKIKNFHFRQSEYRLKMPEGFSEWKEQEGLTYGLNFMHGSPELDFFMIEVHVRNNIVIHENGLNELLNEIIRRKLVSSLWKKEEKLGEARETDPPYTDDLLLQERILHYLKSMQVSDHKIILVSPHLFEFETIKKKNVSDYQSRTVTGIFTIELVDGYGLVWEFYNLNHQNATYVFKCTPNNYQNLVDRLTRSISLRSGVRAALNASRSKHTDQAEQLELFRRGLGYVDNFKITRGGKGAFKQWERKLKEEFGMPTPEYVDEAVWSNVLENLLLKDSRGRPVKPGKKKSQTKIDKNRKRTEDDKVKITTLKQEEVYNPQDNAEYEEKQPAIEKIRELNSLLNTLLKNDIAT